MKIKNHNFIKNKYSDHIFYCKNCSMTLNLKRKIYYIRLNVKVKQIGVQDYYNLIEKNKLDFEHISDLLSCEEMIIKKLLE